MSTPFEETKKEEDNRLNTKHNIIEGIIRCDSINCLCLTKTTLIKIIESLIFDFKALYLNEI